MTDTTAASAPNLWSWLTATVTALAPSLNTVLSATAGVVLGVSGLATYQVATTPKLVLQAADKPKAEPAPPIRVVLEPLEAVEARLVQKIDVGFRAIEDKCQPPKVVGPKRTARASR